MARPANSTSTSSPDFRTLLRGATALAACAALLAGQPIAAQDTSAEPSLEDLIPDEAVADPEGWAAQGAGPVATGEGDPADDAADQPLEELDPDFGADFVDEPVLALEDPADLELPPLEPLEADEEVQFATFDDVIPPLPEGSEERLSDELVLVFPSDMSLFPQRDEFIDRFAKLSAVEVLSDDGSQARLAAQARSDEDLLLRMLRTYGYFDGQVIRSIVPPEDREGADYAAGTARFDVLPGSRFTVGTVDLGALDTTGADFEALRASYKVFPGDPLSIDAIVDQRYELDLQLGERGYPFAAISEPSLLVDHARGEGDVTLPVTPGGRYAFGQVTSNMEDFMSGRHLSEIARFDAGDIYQRSLELDLRRAIQATGLVGSVTLTPVEVTPPGPNGEPGTVDMAVEMTPAPLRSIAGSIGYGTDEGIRLAGSWEHRNLFPSEGMLRVRGIAGTQEQLLGVTFRKNNYHGRDRILTVDAFASTIDTTAYDANTLSLVGTYERISTLLFQKPLSWGGGLELVATREREQKVKGQKSPNETYLIAALPGYAQIDTSDSLLDPTRGFRLRGAVTPEISRLNGDVSPYVRLQVDLSYYQSVSEDVVLAARSRVGTIQGTAVSNIAPSRRFYAGGGGSVRGYGYQAIGPRNGVGDPNGGRSLLEMSAEARIRTGLLDRSVSFVPFVDMGTVTRSTVPDFSDVRVGVGLGVRYHTGFGPIRLDVGLPLNREPGDGPVGVYVALGQAF